MTDAPTTFTTRRLILRRPTLADAHAIFRNYARDPEVTRYLVWCPHEDVGETEEFLRSCLKAWEEGTELTWVLTLRSTDEAIGMLAVRPGEPTRLAANLGYVLSRKHWGQGLMTEAVRHIMDWLRSSPEIYRIWATCDVEHTASARVLEKSGMQREGVLRRWGLRPNISSEPRDTYVYAWVR